MPEGWFIRELHQRQLPYAGPGGALVHWINDGAPRGPGADPIELTPQPTNAFPYTWPAALGTPDVVLRIPTQTLPAFGIVNYVYVNVANTLPQDAWLRAAVVRPSSRRVVHHCLVYFGNNSAFNGLDGYTKYVNRLV